MTPKSAYRGYRETEFNLYEGEDGRWNWVYYPKKGTGGRVSGIADTEEKARQDCYASIDAWLG